MRFYLDWVEDKAWADKYTREVLSILERVVPPKFSVATEYQDRSEATDAVSQPIAVGVRIRRSDVAQRDFTVRYERRSRIKTEWQKVSDGWGDIYFYGWAGNGLLADWIVIDLQRMREPTGKMLSPHLVRPGYPLGAILRGWDNWNGGPKWNRDEGSSFVWWPVASLSINGYLVAKKS